jgi:hypothetical protein
VSIGVSRPSAICRRVKPCSFMSALRRSRSSMLTRTSGQEWPLRISDGAGAGA